MHSFGGKWLSGSIRIRLDSWSWKCVTQNFHQHYRQFEIISNHLISHTYICDLMFNLKSNPFSDSFYSKRIGFMPPLQIENWLPLHIKSNLWELFEDRTNAVATACNCMSFLMYASSINPRTTLHIPQTYTNSTHSGIHSINHNDIFV